jgi:hypothetical protein
VQNGVKSVINEGHVSLDAEIVLRPYLFWHWSSVTEVCNIVLRVHALRPVEVGL